MANVIHNYRGFFSDYYLGQLLEKQYRGQLGEKGRDRTYAQLKRQWERARGSLGHGSKVGITRQRWLYPLLNRLGFNLEPGEEIYTDKETLKASHMYIPEGKERPVVYLELMPWGVDFDVAPPGQGRRNTPQRKMERLLNESGVNWGILANGPALRLLRRQDNEAGRAYFQVDLENMFDGDYEEEFRIFWALFRADAFIPDDKGMCLLDRINQESRRHAVQVSDFLKDSVREALETLIRGMLEDPANKGVLNPDKELEEIYHQSLYFLYRLLFILYAESLELLPVGVPTYRDSYSLESLKQLIIQPDEIFHNNEYRLWESLQALFRLIYYGVEAGDFRVAPYNGRLFSPQHSPLLEKCRVNDAVMQQVLMNLCFTAPQKDRGREPISYRELGVEQLGHVYEDLLEYEPKIATEEMVVIKEGKEQRVMPAAAVDNENAVVERISSNTFYLAAWGGRRKGSGTYYTPKPITEFLVEQALAPLVEGKKSEEILQLKILDPAMGSGAFLVAACHYLAEAYGMARIEEGLDEDGRLDELERAAYRRLVAENCLYGVDVNPLAVELAKVSLWLTTLSEDKPLTFLDHRLRVGNSLIGASLDNLEEIPDEPLCKEDKRENRRFKGQWDGLFATVNIRETLKELTRHRDLLRRPSERVEDVRTKERLLESVQQKGTPYAKLKEICDLWCAVWFWPKRDLAPPHTGIYRDLVNYIVSGEDLLFGKSEQYLAIARQVSEEYRFFHWELEFPEVYRREDGSYRPNPGFDAVIGNPPWDIVKPNSQEFFTNYDPHYRKLKKQQALKRIEELCQVPEVAENWTRYQEKFEHLSRYFRKSKAFSHLGTGDLNTFKLFLERFHQLLRQDGRLSIIVPSGIYTDLGCKELRKLLFDHSQTQCLYCYENRKQIFPIHRSFKFVLLSAAKGGKTEAFHGAFMLHDLKLLPELNRRALEIPVSLVRKMSPEANSVMEFKSQRDIEIMKKMFRFPLLGEEVPGRWRVKLTREFDMTNDSHLFNTEGKGLPLYEGKMIWHYNHQYAQPRYWVEEKKARKVLVQKEIKRIEKALIKKFLPKAKGNKRELLRKFLLEKRGRELDETDVRLDYESYRLGFRDVAASTNERALICTIAPPKTFAGNTFVTNVPLGLKIEESKPFIKYQANLNLLELCFMVGVFNSFTVDYIIRNKITTHLNMFYMYDLPIPRYTTGDPYFEEIVERCGKLVCTTPEFDELAKEIGLGSHLNGVTDPDKRRRLQAEIDAYVALIYGITADELDYILSTFPLVEEKVKQEVRAAYTRLNQGVKPYVGSTIRAFT